MPTLHFERPLALVALAALPGLWLLWRRARGRAERASRAVFGPAHARPATRLNAARGRLRLAALALLVVAAAGPVGLGAGVRQAVGLPLVFVLDVSASMGAADTPPTRLQAARRTIARITDALPSVRTALVASASDAAVVCPPTADRAAFLALLGRARTDWMTGRGTDLAPALKLAGGLLQEGPGVVVLVSDGENHGTSPRAAVRHLARGGSILHTVTVGTAPGTLVPGGRGVVPEGEERHTRARPEQMAEWAALGGGSAWHVGGAEAPVFAPSRVAPAGIVASAAARLGEAATPAPWLSTAAVLLLAADALLSLLGRQRG